MDLDDDPDRHQRVLRAASDALGATRATDSQGAVDRIAEFVRTSPDGYGDLRLLLSLLMRECGTMVNAVSPITGTAQPVRVEAHGIDGEVLSIDELSPPVRTAMRALLAEIYGDPASAQTHIDLALDHAEPRELVVIVLQAVWFTKAMAMECHRRGLPPGGLGSSRARLNLGSG